MKKVGDAMPGLALRCAVLCCAVLCCAVLCCAVLCCAVLCCAVLCCAVLCCAVLCCAEPGRMGAALCSVLEEALSRSWPPRPGSFAPTHRTPRCPTNSVTN